MPHQDNFYLTSHSLFLGLGDHIFPINFSVLGSEVAMLLLEPTLCMDDLIWSVSGYFGPEKVSNH